MKNDFDKYFDEKFGNLIKGLPEDSPSDDFVNKVMKLCYTVEIKQPFNIFVWIREQNSRIIIGLTMKIIRLFKNVLDDYKEMELMTVQS